MGANYDEILQQLKFCRIFVVFFGLNMYFLGGPAVGCSSDQSSTLVILTTEVSR
jgi:hypothetical protein